MPYASNRILILINHFNHFIKQQKSLDNIYLIYVIKCWNLNICRTCNKFHNRRWKTKITFITAYAISSMV